MEHVQCDPFWLCFSWPRHARRLPQRRLIMFARATLSWFILTRTPPCRPPGFPAIGLSRRRRTGISIRPISAVA